MTEAEWLACNEPRTMLEFLSGGRASERKLRLFSVACYRRYAWLEHDEESLSDERSERAVVIAERYADGEATREDLRMAYETANQARIEVGRFAYDAARCASPFVFAEVCLSAGNTAKKERLARSGLLREMFGPVPFRPVTLELAWLTSTVRQIAEGIYQEKVFDRIPILGDALEEAGCTNADILNHCRQPGEHVRGCWVVDLLLGKS